MRVLVGDEKRVVISYSFTPAFWTFPTMPHGSNVFIFKTNSRSMASGSTPRSYRNRLRGFPMSVRGVRAVGRRASGVAVRLKSARVANPKHQAQARLVGKAVREAKVIERLSKDSSFIKMRGPAFMAAASRAGVFDKLANLLDKPVLRGPVFDVVSRVENGKRVFHQKPFFDLLKTTNSKVVGDALARSGDGLLFGSALRSSGDGLLFGSALARLGYGLLFSDALRS